MPERTPEFMRGYHEAERLWNEMAEEERSHFDPVNTFPLGTAAEAGFEEFVAECEERRIHTNER